MPPGNIGILHALQDANRTTRLDHSFKQQVFAAVLDEPTRDQVRLCRILRGARIDTLLLDLTADFGRKALPHQLFGEIDGWRDQHQAGNRCGCVRPCGDLAREQQSEPAAHG